MADPAFADGAAALFLVGDDAEAKATVSELAAALGFDPVDASLETPALPPSQLRDNQLWDGP
jgi:predicted dinucleotide-binding enzyme